MVDHVSDSDDLDVDFWLCSSCGRMWPSVAAARYCCTDDDRRGDA